MSTFTSTEIEYLNSQLLGRFATVGKDGRPHVVPLGVFYDPETETLVIGCALEMARTKKFRDTQANPDVAVVIDDIVSVDPWIARGIEVRGRAEAHWSGGAEIGKRLGAAFPFDEVYLRIHPRRVISFGIDGDVMSPNIRDVA